VPLHTLAFNVASVKAGISRVTCSIRVRSGLIVVAWKPSE